VSKHTPGPWHLHPTGRPNVLGLWTVFHGPGESCHNQICQAEEADARLIAAAPDLLAACQAILETLDMGTWLTGGMHSVVAMRSAVARATGEGTQP
jgi:hypothetical protein